MTIDVNTGRCDVIGWETNGEGLEGGENCLSFVDVPIAVDLLIALMKEIKDEEKNFSSLTFLGNVKRHSVSFH